MIHGQTSKKYDNLGFFSSPVSHLNLYGWTSKVLWWIPLGYKNIRQQVSILIDFSSEKVKSNETHSGIDEGHPIYCEKMLHHQKIMEMSSYAKGLYLDFSLKKDTRIFKDTLEKPHSYSLNKKKVWLFENGVQKSLPKIESFLSSHASHILIKLVREHWFFFGLKMSIFRILEVSISLTSVPGDPKIFFEIFTHRCLKYVLGSKFDDLSASKNWSI